MKKFHLRRSDWMIVVPSLVLLFTIAIFQSDNFNVQKLVQKRSELETRKTAESLKYPQTEFSPLSIPIKIEIDIDPEFIRALDAALPKFNGQFMCQKVRYKWVPVTSVKINGKTLKGRYKAKYRGFCSKHWGGKQKSLKVKVIEGERLLGRKTLNLNAMSSDPELFEPWSMHFFKLTGGLTSRVGFINFYLNGKNNGLRQLVENLDQDLILSQGYNKGAIYRERTHAHLGRNGKNLEELQRYWRKNSMSDAPWGDWREFNSAIERSMRKRSRLFLKYLNIEHYINYLAFTSLIGTNHVNDHNIPFYRPKNDLKFIPIGYDFSEPYMALFGMKFSAFQIPYMNLNWLNELIYSDQKLRIQFHKRTAEILSDFYPQIIEDYSRIFNTIRTQLDDDVKSNRILDLTIKNTESSPLNGYDQYLKHFGLGRTRFLTRRFKHFYQMYHSPVVRIQKNWQNSIQRDLYIEGFGAYVLDLSSLNGRKCKQGDYLKVQYHDSKVQNLIQCLNEKIKTESLIVERADVSYQNYKLRNSLGGILVTLNKSPGLELPQSFFKVHSLQTNQTVSKIKTWPFQITGEDQNKLRIDLLEELAEVSYEKLEDHPSSFYFGIPFGGSKNGTLKSNVYTFDHFIEPVSYLGYTVPFLCYNFDGSKDCLEFTFSLLNSREWLDKQLLRKLTIKQEHDKLPKKKILKIAKNQEKSCSRFTFSKGEWHIPTPLEFSSSCIVEFKAGATLKFGNDSYLILNNSPIFENGSERVTFTALSNEWGGIIIRNAQRVTISNSLFEKSNEYMVGNRRFTGSLTILNPQTYVVKNSSFINNYGDDGLNIKGGTGEIKENLFINNRDAIDVDLGKSTITHNFIFDSKDDGVDSGTAKLTIISNLILNSGDKAISVGEKSSVRILENLIKQNNVGIAVKDNSKAKINKNYFQQNKIALNIYNKRLSSFDSKSTVLKGKSFFKENDINFKYNKTQQDNSEMQQLLEEDFKSLLFKKINNSCIPCKAEAGRINL